MAFSSSAMASRDSSPTTPSSSHPFKINKYVSNKKSALTYVFKHVALGLGDACLDCKVVEGVEHNGLCRTKKKKKRRGLFHVPAIIGREIR